MKSLPHQSALTYGKWKGSGYIIIDPNNGSGAYLISGGANGAAVTPSDKASSAFFSGMMSGLVISSWMLMGDVLSNLSKEPLFTLAVFIGLVLPYLITNILGTIIYGLFDEWTDLQYKCYISGLLWGLTANALTIFIKGKNKSRTTGFLALTVTAIRALDAFVFDGSIPTPKECSFAKN